MKTDINGCSTTQAGKEQFEEYEHRGQTFFQYDYRHPNGDLFSCVAKSVIEAQAKRDLWMEAKQL